LLYCKDGAGFVHLQGIRPVGVNPQLPVGFRQAADQSRATAEGLVGIDVNGTITDVSGDGSNLKMRLNGISFKAA
jgi:hypothetical protein